MQLINSHISYYHGNQLISGVVIHTPTAKLCVTPNIHQVLRMYMTPSVQVFTTEYFTHFTSMRACMCACVYVTECSVI